MRRNIRLTALAVIAGLLLPGAAGVLGQASPIFVDPDISIASCRDYDAAARRCGAGRAVAYKALSEATAAATPGTVVSLRGGTYREALNPGRSGTANAPIVFRRHADETAVITGVDIGITIVDREYVEVDGLTVSEVNGWVRLQDSRNITIRNSTFSGALARGTTGSVKVVRSSNNRILRNTLTEGTDNLVLVDASNRNLVEGNTFTTARHSLVSVRCSSFNVFRGNRFSNERQKAIEIYDCEGVGSDNPVRDDDTRRNLFERNEVTMTRGAGRDHEYNGIQHGAQQTIVRRNVFRHNAGGGVNFQEYPRESRYVYGNRMYHNTFYANRCHAIIGDGGTSHYRDQQVKNNLLYKNVSCSNGDAQVRIPDRRAVVLAANAIETDNPGFVDEEGHDFHLAPGSRMIDAAEALTVTAAAGRGTSLVVKDAGYFYDGNGIARETGDTIQLLGTTDTAVVTAVNLAAATLTLDRPLTWSAGQGVALRYAGAAPDMGAFEFGLDAAAAAASPGK